MCALNVDANADDYIPIYAKQFPSIEIQFKPVLIYQHWFESIELRCFRKAHLYTTTGGPFLVTFSSFASFFIIFYSLLCINSRAIPLLWWLLCITSSVMAAHVSAFLHNHFNAFSRKSFHYCCETQNYFRAFNLLQAKCTMWQLNFMDWIESLINL